MHSLYPAEFKFISFVSIWGCADELCRLWLLEIAAKVAVLRKSGQVSVGQGFNTDKADLKV